MTFYNKSECGPRDFFSSFFISVDLKKFHSFWRHVAEVLLMHEQQWRVFTMCMCEVKQTLRKLWAHERREMSKQSQ